VSSQKPLPPLPPSRGRDRELFVGLLVIGGIAAILVTLFTFTNAALWRGRYIVNSTVPNAGGIRKGDPVQMRGVNIGRVLKFFINKDDVTLRLEIEGEYKVPIDSRVELKSAGLLGGMVANVIPGTSPKTMGWNDTLPGTIGEGAFEGVDELTKSAQKAVGQVEKMLSDDTVANIHQGTGEARQLLSDLRNTVAEQRKELIVLSQNLRKSSDSLQKITAGPELDRTVKRLDSLTERMDGVVNGLEKSSHSMEAVLARIERGEGSLGKLTKDDELYVNAAEAAANLKKAAAEMARLTEDIRLNPKKYVKLSLF
jgi:phospholipid/cholesterol/gamma-HCH transport system substrate-binding protein